MIVKDLGLVDYQPTCEAMRKLTAERDANTEDELWLLEHSPVFTLGLNGKDEHVLNTHDIPLVNTDRGGQVTFHGPGQLVVYTLIDLKRQKIGVREMISRIENSVISMLAKLDVRAQSRADAPGVYVDGRKIASLGLRVKHGACYHGLSLNVAMDLTPFSYINPCGFQGLEVIDLKSLACDITMDEAKEKFVSEFNQQMRKSI
ncbi:MAG: lipoyl(octanoyl) transferase LipB [Proteobacteria bacterium]|nr:lipoyl(octanoyl) transferase LipB [Pseudomonadota bacterium]